MSCLFCCILLALCSPVSTCCCKVWFSVNTCFYSSWLFASFLHCRLPSGHFLPGMVVGGRNTAKDGTRFSHFLGKCYATELYPLPLKNTFKIPQTCVMDETHWHLELSKSYLFCCGQLYHKRFLPRKTYVRKRAKFFLCSRTYSGFSLHFHAVICGCLSRLYRTLLCC